MAIIKTLSRSFAGGEVTPELADRVDLGQYQTGLNKCENAIAYPHGVVSKRGGTRFVSYAKSAWDGEGAALGRNVRLIPFQFSSSQSYVFEFGHKYMRVHTDGGTLLRSGNVVAEGIFSYGVFSGDKIPMRVRSKNHGLENGSKIRVTVTPNAEYGTKIGEIYKDGYGQVAAHVGGAPIPVDADTGIPVYDKIKISDYFEVTDNLIIAGRQVNTGYLLKSLRNDPYNIAISTSASIDSDGEMTNTEHSAGTYGLGMYLYSEDIPSVIRITNMNSNSGSVSGQVYTTNYSGSFVETSITGRGVNSSFWDIVPKEDWSYLNNISCYV